MEHASTAEQESNRAIVAAIARIVDGPVKAPPAECREAHRLHFGMFVGWFRAARQREREHVA